MSFSSDAKQEITQRRLHKACCVRAACYGIACFAKYFDARGVVVQTELACVAQYAQRMFARCGVAGTIDGKGSPRRHAVRIFRQGPAGGGKAACAAGHHGG
jgi:hypothetical protein